MSFSVTQKSVRDQYRRLLDTCKQKMSQEIGASGSSEETIELHNYCKILKKIQMELLERMSNKQTK